jgi:hypothetical protein
MTTESRNSGARVDFIARQGLGKQVPAETNTRATIEGLLGKDVFCWGRSEAI